MTPLLSFNARILLRGGSIESHLLLCESCCVIRCFVHVSKHFQLIFFCSPCCVFSRLFSTRMTKSGEVVSTYYELIDWLVAKHPDIRVTRLPFSGANLALWATFVK